MKHDEKFEPKLGRIKSGRGRSFLKDVRGAVGRVQGFQRGGGRQSRFDGSRVGRGAGIGRVVASEGRDGAFRGRRVVIKARLVRLGGSGSKAANAGIAWRTRIRETVRAGTPSSAPIHAGPRRSPRRSSQPVRIVFRRCIPATRTSMVRPRERLRSSLAIPTFKSPPIPATWSSLAAAPGSPMSSSLRVRAWGSLAL